MKSRHIKTVCILLLIAIVLTVGRYSAEYPIDLNLETLPKDIQKFSGLASVGEEAIVVVYGGVVIGNSEYYLMEIDGELGYANLKAGLFGRYKIDHLSYGSGDFREGIVENKGKQYLIIAGRDSEAQIDHITAEVGGETYNISVGSKAHFIAMTEISVPVEDPQIDRSALKLYNKNGDEITVSYDLSGGGIQ